MVVRLAFLDRFVAIVEVDPGLPLDLANLPCDDGSADDGETLTATFSNPSPFGSMGEPDNASSTIDDGSGAIVFMAYFGSPLNSGDGGVHVDVTQTEFPFVLPISGGKGRYGRVSVTP